MLGSTRTRKTESIHLSGICLALARILSQCVSTGITQSFMVAIHDMSIGHHNHTNRGRYRALKERSKLREEKQLREPAYSIRSDQLSAVNEVNESSLVP